MAQGKTKIKSKLPANAKHKTNKTDKKNSAFNKRKRCPVQKKMVGKLKIQDAITKTVNKKNEDEMRSRAISTNQVMSNAQNAVKKHHEKKAAATEAESMAAEED